MHEQLLWILLFLSVLEIYSKEPELPLCPTNIQYFPQNLPMHCRMPTAADLQNIQNLPMPISSQTMPAFPPPFYQSPPPGKQSEMMPLPPGLPGPPRAMPGPMPGLMPGPLPMPIPLPAGPGPGHKLPVIVMPFYSPDNSFKKPQAPEGRPRIRIRKRRRPRYYSDTEDSSDTDTSSNELADSSTEYEGLWRGRRNSRRSNKHHREKRRRHQRQELLTPVLQYVTKEGYVIFEKKISRGEAKDWLKVKSTDNADVTTKIYKDLDEFDDNDETEMKVEKAEDKVEVRTEKNTQKRHKKKLRYGMPK